MAATVGIDISAAQGSVAPGPWLFVVHKATEGHDYVDPRFKERYATLASPPALRGAYHYARPGDGFDGKAQAQFFAVTVIAAGFKPGVDMFQLDCESMGNFGVNGAAWAAFIEAFMLEATKLLGKRGFLYMGWPWAVTTLGAALATQLVGKYPWWLPDYGINDGQVHSVSAPFEVWGDIVLHQYSSFGALDRNVIGNAAKWAQVTAPPVDLRAIAEALAFIKALTTKPLKRGDKGPNAAKLNGLLAHHGYHVSGDVYDLDTVKAVADFKRRRKLKNRDGARCGRACTMALYK